MKITIFLISVLSLLSSFNFTENVAVINNKKAVIIVKAVNIKKPQGKVSIALYNSEDSFMKKPFKSLSVEVSEIKDLTFTFEDIPKGTYAITIMHDVNGNGELDANFMGMPTEPYGISNEGYNMFGPPKYEESKFSVDEQEITMTIKLR